MNCGEHLGTSSPVATQTSAFESQKVATLYVICVIIKSFIKLTR